MPAIARVGDSISCGDSLAMGSGNVFANNIPICRVGVDLTHGHCYPPVPIISGSNNVFINNIPVDRVGDPIPVHCCNNNCHSGNISFGSSNVFANG